MCRIDKTWIAGGMLLLSFLSMARAGAYLTVEEALQLAFPKDVQVRHVPVALTAAQRDVLRKKTGIAYHAVYERTYAAWRDGELSAVAFLDDVLGKTDYITYMVVMNPDGLVRQVEILAYREPKGYEVRYRSFRRQYTGKGPDDAIRLNRDIRNIAGATLSCRAITDGVRKFVHLYALCVQEKLLMRSPQQDVVLPGMRMDRMDRPGRFVRAAYVFDAILEVAVEGDRDECGRALQCAMDEARRLEGILNAWREDSEVSWLNRSAARQGVACSEDLWRVLRQAMSVYRHTGGAFDVTVGPFCRLWRRAGCIGRIPDAEDVNRLKALVGMDKLRFDCDAHSLSILPGMQLDLGAIAKGYVVDAVIRTLKQRGMKAGFVNFGHSSLAAFGRPRLAPGWLVRLVSQHHGVLDEIMLQDQSLGASGDAERYFQIGRRRYSHIIHPLSGRPVRQTRLVFVMGEHAARLDALATGMAVMSMHDIQAMSHDRDYAFLVVDADRNAGPYASMNWPGAGS